MHRRNPTVSSLSHCIIAALVSIAALAMVAEIPARFVLAATNTNISSAGDSLAIYRWNLADENQPLISLPDHVGAGVDWSLSYSLDQFEFPLFQSVYYNQRARKYILMVIAKQGR